MERATIYIYAVSGIGLAVLIQGLYDWSCPDWQRFLAYLALAMVAGALKVRLPGQDGTFSLSFVVTLMSVADLTYSECLIVATAAALVQSCWQPARRPTARKVLFNIANFVICISACCLAASSATLAAIQGNIAAQFSVTGCIFFGLNTLFVSAMIAIVESKSIAAVWQAWFLMSFPYYFVGAAVAALAVATGRAHGWQTGLLVLPVMLFVFAYFQMLLKRYPTTDEADPQRARDL
jgi:hypothetical protein